ncbi:Vitamin B12 import ATP-binding protein BtuD [Sporomusa silvacetica DSM 10669]|uniref:Vitamin B12 import ATP-binding protein BtuD n=1 Tax=Sporomusa silvacetica DSM 10669 TaxID=1123289 RepID=A0ABZ3INH5_9FIRM|nr:putative multidrug export ATP-binding/permease protein [Sporomusa silvacetica DSM 10669]
MILLLKNVWGYYSQYKLYASVYFIGVLFDLAVESFIALSFKFLLDNAIMPKNQNVMIMVLILLVAGTLIARFGYAFRCYLYAKMLAGIMANIRYQLFQKMQQLSLKYYSNARAGDILSLFSNDLASIEYMINLAVPAGVAAFLSIVINTVIIFNLDWELALISSIGLLLCSLGTYIFNRRAFLANEHMKDMQASFLSRIEENINAQQLIKSFNLQNILNRSFETHNTQLSQITRKALFLNYLMEITPNSIIAIFNVIIICLGAYFAFKDYISPGTLVSFNNLFVGLSTAVYSFTWVFPVLMGSSASMKRIQAFQDQPTEVKNLPEAREIQEFQQGIELHNVNFGYTNEDVCLNNVNLKIPKGASVAIVGPSGSGKSSILNLIMRFYDPQSGSITIDGQDLRSIKVESLHRLIGIVLQENFLFNDSIRENLKIANPEASDDDIAVASAAAKIYKFIITLPNGYDTVVGERGGQLSGGQRQRIALARAILCKPSILILDEATSALDPKTEKAINKTLKKLHTQMTIINITHRLANIQDYDIIYVIEKGRVVETGTHQKLMEKQGLYAELCQKQEGFSIKDDFGHAEMESKKLADISLFRNLDTALLEELADLFVSEYYPAGKTIINKTELGDRFYVIVRGTVEIRKTLADGSEKIVNVLWDGDYFGEFALLKERHQGSANVRTRTPCLLLSLRRRQFERVISKNPGLRVEMEKEMDKRLAQLAAGE